MKWTSIFLVLFFLTGCAASMPVQTTQPTPAETEQTVPIPAAAPTETEPPDPMQVLLDSMTVEERVGQLFLARCSSDSALSDIREYHLGGFVLFSADFENQTPDSIRQTLSGYQAADIPLLLAVDEEGGTVTRISRYPAFRAQRFPSPRESFAGGGLMQALTNEEEKCQLLQSLGLNVNLGPVCDISTEPGAFMYQRSLGQDAETTGSFVAGTVKLMNAYKIGSVLKHFPGYGSNGDTHTGLAVDNRSLEELEKTDLIPFAAGIDAGCGAVLVSHTIVQAMDREFPASLSPAVHQYLRETMHFNGVILTDDLVMQAIADQYGVREAAVLAVQAGNDMLCSTDYQEQYAAVLDAVLDGRIDFDSLNTAVLRVLRWKQTLGLL
ncbi:MAG: glycoside hydrolase family 3 protein [Faecousia sp.]